jgi:uncharacterized protein YgbK (DUF1537 family)
MARAKGGSDGSMKPLYVFYGDDFTGSTDALEALASSRVRCVLFTGIPSAQQLSAFADCEAYGIAGESRSRTPAWMSKYLPDIFTFLKGSGAQIYHYKVCSTFDSAPRRGNIGRALEIGRRVFDSTFVPVVVGAPRLQRYMLFGNLFASFGGSVYRIDQHPAMRHHPSTPMRDGDLREHLAKQTSAKSGLIDMCAFDGGTAALTQELEREIAAGTEAIFFDGWNDDSLTQTGAVLWEQACKRPLFAIGSSGLTYGLTAHWRSQGVTERRTMQQKPSPVDAVLVASGSCSPATEKQIRWALRNGFAGIHFDAERLSTCDRPTEVYQREIERARKALLKQQSVVVYSALGANTRHKKISGEQLGRGLGMVLREIAIHSGVRRVIVAGGDTSSHAVRQLGLYALTFLCSLEPGAPLCQGYSEGSPLNGVEMVLKGGQIGSEDFFARVRDGRVV